MGRCQRAVKHQRNNNNKSCRVGISRDRTNGFVWFGELIPIHNPISLYNGSSDLYFNIYIFIAIALDEMCLSKISFKCKLQVIVIEVHVTGGKTGNALAFNRRLCLHQIDSVYSLVLLVPR